MIQQLFENLKKAQGSPQVKAIVITGANGTFSGGFDISQFKSGGADDSLSESVNTGFLDLVETGPKPTVAALSNIALGGGCELAIACNARVATPGASHCALACLASQSNLAGYAKFSVNLVLRIIPSFVRGYK